MTDKFGLTEEELDKIITTDSYKELVSRMQETSPRFKSLPVEQQKIAVALCVSGKTDIIPGLWRLLQKRKIPSVDEFLTQPYIGSRASFYARETLWKTAIRDVFDPNKQYKEVVVTGAIGIAKTSNCLLMHMYNLYRINSLRNPQLSMGTGVTNKPLNLQVMSVNLKKVQSTIIDPLVEMLKCNQYYQKVNKVDDFQEFDNEKYEHVTPWAITDNGIVFPHNVRVVSGSKDYHALGEDLFGGMLDEAEGRTLSGIGASVQQVFDTYAQIVTRITSRLLHARFTLSTLSSQISDEMGVMTSYIKEKQGGDDLTKVISFNLWDVRYPDEMAKGHWYVLRGTKIHPSRNLSGEDKVMADQGMFEVPSGCELIKYPYTFYPNFSRHVEQALRELAGKSTIGDEKPFDDLSNIVDDKLIPLVEIDATLGEKDPLWKQIPKDLYNMTPEGPRLKRYNGARRYIHWDMADSGVAGLSLVHKELSRSGKTMVIADFVCRITSKNRISFQRIFDFGVDLKEIFGLNIFKQTTDQYQSTAFRQHLEANNAAEIVEHLSVDTHADAYQTWSNLVADDAFKVGKCDVMMTEMGNIFIEKNKPYVATGRKDTADSMCGAVFNALSNASDRPAFYYEDYGESLTRKFEDKLPDGYIMV